MMNADCRCPSLNNLPACFLFHSFFSPTAFVFLSSLLFPFLLLLLHSGEISGAGLRGYAPHVGSSRYDDESLREEEIKGFRAVSELVGGWRNIIIRFQA